MLINSVRSQPVGYYAGDICRLGVLALTWRRGGMLN